MRSPQNVFAVVCFFLFGCGTPDPGAITGTLNDDGPIPTDVADGAVVGEADVSADASDAGVEADATDTTPDAPVEPWGESVDGLVLNTSAQPLRWNTNRTRLLIGEPVDLLAFSGFYRGRLIAVDLLLWEYVVVSDSAVIELEFPGDLQTRTLMSESGNTVAWFQWPPGADLTKDIHSQLETANWHFFHWSSRTDELLVDFTTSWTRPPVFLPNQESLFAQHLWNQVDFYDAEKGTGAYAVDTDGIADSSGLYFALDGVIQRHIDGAATIVATVPPAAKIHNVAQGFAVVYIGAGIWHMLDLRSGKLWQKMSQLVDAAAFVPDRGVVHPDRQRMVLTEGAEGRAVYVDLRGAEPQVHDLEGESEAAALILPNGILRTKRDDAGKRLRVLWRLDEPELVLSDDTCFQIASPDEGYLGLASCTTSTYQLWNVNDWSLVAQHDILARVPSGSSNGWLTWMNGQMVVGKWSETLDFSLVAVESSTGAIQEVSTDMGWDRGLSPDGQTVVLARQVEVGWHSAWADAWWRPGMDAPAPLPMDSVGHQYAVVVANSFVVRFHRTSDTTATISKTLFPGLSQ